MRLKLICTSTALAVLALTAATSCSQTASPKLYGTVGPGYTITLKQKEKLVRTLDHGTYTFVISDRSSNHDFTIDGTGLLPRIITGDGFIGTKTVTLTLKRGAYEYYCAAHEPVMNHMLKVT